MGLDKSGLDLRGILEQSSTISSFVGISLNLLLVYLIFYKTRARLEDYCPIFIQKIIVDLSYITINAITKTHFDYKNGSFFIMLTGPLQCLPYSSIDKITSVWMFALSLALTNVPVQFIYRYFLITRKKSPSMTQYSFLLFIGILFAIIHAVAFYYVFYPNEKLIQEKSKLLKVDSYYLREIPNFIVADIANPNLQLYFGYYFVMIFVMYFIIIGSSLKVWKILKLQKDQLSPILLDVHQQVNLTLLIQATIPCAICLVPLTTAIIMTKLHANLPGLGIIIAIIFSWMPSFNAIISIAVIRSYRKHLQKIITCKNRVQQQQHRCQRQQQQPRIQVSQYSQA